MSVRNDIAFSPNLIPRLITLDNTADELIVQDLHDTTADFEDDLAGGGGMTFDKFIDSAGKEDLGGGVLVGITSTLQNAQLEFEARTTPIQAGTVTSESPSQCIDTSATFISNGVKRGDILINFTDFSMTSVLSVESETVLTHGTMEGGILNKCSTGDVYRDYPIVQVEIAGGNLVALDDLGDPIDAIFPSFGVQVVRTSSSSSTITEIAANTYLSAGGIHIDLNNGVPGTSFPIGTPSMKSNNLTDAKTIADEFGITRLFIYSDVVLDQGYPGFIFVGAVALPVIDMNNKNVKEALFKGVDLIGIQNGGLITAHDCTLRNITKMNGFYRGCGLEGTLTADTLSVLVLNDCYSQVPGTSTPILDMGPGNKADASLRQYSGGITVRNFDQVGDNMTIELVAGKVIIESTCTDGTLAVRGVGTLTDNSAGTVVNTDGFMSGEAQRIMRKLLQNRTETNPSTGVMTVYEDDGVTVALTANITEDVAGTIPYSGTSAKVDRRNALTP